MKNKILAIILATFSLNSFAVEKDSFPGLELLEGEAYDGASNFYYMSPLGDVDKDKWSNYIHDYCKKEDSSAPSIRICKDGTVSHVQPGSAGIGGWEGKCGQTAAANLIHGFCGKKMSPDAVDGRILRDITPGVRPDTLRSGLDALFSENKFECGASGDWKWYYSKSQKAFIHAMKRFLKEGRRSGVRMTRTASGTKVQRNPLALLVRDPGSHNLHWITLVDIETKGTECKVVVNHWDNQYKVPCETLAKWSKGVNSSYPFLFRPYNMVVLRDI